MHDRDHLVYNIATTVNNSINTPGVPAPLVVDLEEILPGVTSSLRMEERDIFVLSGNEVFKERMLASDTNFLQFFKISYSRFLMLLFIALCLVVPIVWYIMSLWLENFAYGVSIHWWVFLVSGFLIILISLLTISFQGIRAAMTDPVESLRNE